MGRGKGCPSGIPRGMQGQEQQEEQQHWTGTVQ